MDLVWGSVFGRLQVHLLLCLANAARTPTARTHRPLNNAAPVSDSQESDVTIGLLLLPSADLLS